MGTPLTDKFRLELGLINFKIQDNISCATDSVGILKTGSMQPGVPAALPDGHLMAD